MEKDVFWTPYVRSVYVLCLRGYEMDSLIQNIYSKLSLVLLQRTTTKETLLFLEKARGSYLQKYFYTYINDGNHNIFYNDLRLLHNRYIKLKSFETEKAIEKNSIIKFTFAILNPRENFQKIKYLSISIYILPFLQRKMSYQGSN